jgi:hypothetical protein
MDQGRMYEAMYKVQHRHKDGSWADMAEVRPPHDAADLDPERSWVDGRLFKCTTCEEGVEMRPLDDERLRSLG